MNIDGMLSNLITTPAYLDPTKTLRTITDPDSWHSPDYVFLEDATWTALCEIARERGCAMHQLCKDIKLTGWIDENLDEDDYVETSISLVEFASERYLWLHQDGVEAWEFMQAVFRRAVQRHKARLAVPPRTLAQGASSKDGQTCHIHDAAEPTSNAGTATRADTDVCDDNIRKTAAIIKQHDEEKIRAIKLKLENWFEEYFFSGYSEASRAFVDVVSERCLWLFKNPAAAGDFIHRIFLRTVRRRNASLQ
jgi:hypothetical protein